MMFMKARERKANRARIKKLCEVQLLRDASKQRIRKLRAEMQCLVEQAAGADDLDRKILSLEYEEKKADLSTETGHFNDLSRLISQLHGAVMIHEKRRSFDQVAAVADTIDTQSVLHEDDLLTIRRSILEEEADALDSLLVESSASASTVVVDPGFERLVSMEQQKNTCSIPMSPISAEG